MLSFSSVKGFCEKRVNSCLLIIHELNITLLATTVDISFFFFFFSFCLKQKYYAKMILEQWPSETSISRQLSFSISTHQPPAWITFLKSQELCFRPKCHSNDREIDLKN